jgi:hypothetical protein
MSSKVVTSARSEPPTNELHSVRRLDAHPERHSHRRRPARQRLRQQQRRCGSRHGNGTVQTITMAVTGGKVVPPAHRAKVPQGDTVRLVVNTDTADEVHVHGYDLKKDVAAGKSGTLEFVADQSGVFEIKRLRSAVTACQLSRPLLRSLPSCKRP